MRLDVFFHNPEDDYVRVALPRIERKLDQIMANQQQLDDALTEFETSEGSALQEVNDAVQAILQKVQNGAQPPELQPEIDRLQAGQQKLQQAADAIKGQADALNTPPTP